MVRCLHWLPSTSWARTATCTIETWRSITITAAFKPAEISPNQKDMYAYLHLNQTVRMKGKRINYKSESLTTNQNPQEGRLAKKSLKRPSCHPNWSGFPSLVKKSPYEGRKQRHELGQSKPYWPACWKQKIKGGKRKNNSFIINAYWLS